MFFNNEVQIYTKSILVDNPFQQYKGIVIMLNKLFTLFTSDKKATQNTIEIPGAEMEMTEGDFGEGYFAGRCKKSLLKQQVTHWPSVSVKNKK